MLTEQRKIELINLCQTLIKEKSYSGEEQNVAEKIKTAFEELGFDQIHTDAYGNIIGKIEGSKEGPCLLFDGHIDTVPVTEENWSVPPFEGILKDQKLYGRGASDMKGAVSAMITAAAYFAKDCNKGFSGSIYVSCSVHEECFEGVATRKVSEMVKPDYVVIGEASGLNIKRGQRGRAEIIVETFGKSAHSSNPEKGVNAVYHMTKLIQAIKQLEAPYHEILGKGILELTDIQSAPYPGASVVPNYCKATFDRRLLVGETKESVLKPIQEIITSLQQQDNDFQAKVSYATGKEACYTGEVIEAERFFPAWMLEENDPFLEKVYTGLKRSGLDPALSHYAFCTNGSHFAGEAGIKTIGFGPSYEEVAHIDDEYIELEQLYQAIQGYYAIIDALCE